MSEPKIKPSDLKREAEELHGQGRLPSLDDLLAAVADTRKKYAGQIKDARKLKSPADTLAGDIED